MKNNQNLKRGIRNFTSFFLIFLFCIVIALIVLNVAFDVGPVVISKYLIAQIESGVGVSTTVPPNPFNTLAQQLKEKEATLLEKEATLAEKENFLTGKTGEERENKTLGYLLITGGVLLILILLNFYLDYRRRHRETDAKATS